MEKKIWIKECCGMYFACCVVFGKQKCIQSINYYYFPRRRFSYKKKMKTNYAGDDDDDDVGIQKVHYTVHELKLSRKYAI